MDLSWILLALFLVALIRGVLKAISSPMLKNLLRLGSVVVAFLVAFILQITGVFQLLVTSILGIVDLSALLPIPAGVFDLIYGLASTLLGPLLFLIVFFPVLWILRIIIHFVMKGIEKSAAKKAEIAETNAAVAEAAQEPADEEDDEDLDADEIAATSDENGELSEENAECADTEAAAECEVVNETVEEAPAAPIKAEKPKKEKNKKPFWYKEEGWKRAISLATGAISGLLVLGVLLTPMFYYMSIASSATESVEDSDAKDSQIYKIVAIVDDYFVDPYEKSFVKGFYDVLGISDLTNSSTRLGGKITLDNGKSVYADDVLKGILSNGVSIMTQVTSVDSQCPTVKEDIGEIISDPALSSILADVVMSVIQDFEMEAPAEEDFAGNLMVSLVDYYKNADKATIEKDIHAVGNVAGVLAEKKVVIAFIAGEEYVSAMLGDGEFLGEVVASVVSDEKFAPLLAEYIVIAIDSYEVEEPEEDDLMASVVSTFVEYYKDADKTVIEKDLKALGGAIEVLAEEEILSKMMSDDADFAELLADEETLRNVVEAISDLSAFGPTLESAFEIGIDMLGESLHIPEDDAQVYDEFMEELLAAMVKSPDSKYSATDYNTIRGFIYNVESSGKKVTAYKGTPAYDAFMSYYEQWRKIQSAFAHASEDKSYGYFTMEINGELFIYDHNYKTIVKFDGDAKEQYKNKISPVAGIINALTRYASTEIKIENIYTVLDAYAKSGSADEVSRELANRILLKDGFTSKAVTIEKLRAATNFSAWENEEIKENDSRLCVDIIVDLLSIMDTLGNIESIGGIDGAAELADYFVVLGETFDVMKQTSCINELPELLIEGLIKSDMISDYIAPSIAFQSIEIVNNSENQNYVDVMTNITSIIKMGINSFGGVVK